MPAPETLIVFLGATLALALTPGPDLLYIATRSASEGRTAGVVSVLGVSLGLVIHTVALALGLSALLTAVPIAYEVVRWVGAAYLLYLGAKLLVRPSHFALASENSPSRLRTVFIQGLLTNVLNPKVAFFFLAFLPQFVDHAAGPVILQLLLLGLLFNALGSLVNLIVALLASGSTAWLRYRLRSASALQRISGCVLVALGARLAFSER